MVVVNMSDLVKKCKKCNYIGIYSQDYNIHKNCDGELEIVNITCDDLITMSHISNDNNFLQAMIDLKEKDIIEYNLKMSQFKSQLEQQRSSKIQNDTTPKCPHCRSTNIKSISAINRGASIAMLGAFSKKINKSFECKNCGYTW